MRQLKVIATFPGVPVRKDFNLVIPKRTRQLNERFAQAKPKLILDVKELDVRKYLEELFFINLFSKYLLLILLENCDEKNSSQKRVKKI